MWASLVLPSVTRWESEVAYVFFLPFFFFGAPKGTKIDSPRKQKGAGGPSQAFAARDDDDDDDERRGEGRG